LNLAQCNIELGQRALAWRFLQQALHALHRDDPRAEPGRRRLAELEGQLAFVTWRAAPDLPRDASLRCGSAVFTTAAFDVAIPFDPGTLTCRVTAANHGVGTLRLSLASGTSQEVLVSAGPRVMPSFPASSRRSSPASRVWVAAAAGGALGAALTSVGLGAAALHQRNLMREHCDDRGCDAAGLDAAEQGRALAGASTVVFGAALALGLTTAVAWWLTDTRHERPPALSRTAP
jgi:hypothetical protein